MKSSQLPFYEFREGIYEIDEFCCVSSFLIVGEEKALLIDCGVGIGDLKSVVERITDKPYEVVASHNHMDHIGGADAFNEIWMHENDINKHDIETAKNLQDRREYAEMIRKRENKYFPFKKEDIQEWKQYPEFKPMKNEHCFDLGGRKVTAYLCEGHTKGEVVFIDDLTHTLLCGDACNCNWYLKTDLAATPHESLVKARDALKKIQSMKDQYDFVINSHHDYRGFGNSLAPDVLDNLVECLDDLVNKKAVFKEVPDPMSTNGGTRIVAVKGNVEVAVFAPLRIDQI